MGWESLDHTADVGLRVWADGLDALFSEAAVALVSLMGSSSAAHARHERVEIEAPDVDALFVDWLSEILFLFEARSLVPRRVDVRIAEGPWRLSADVAGPDAATLEQTGPQVKAVTYHGLELHRRPGRCEATVYLDV